MQSSTHHIDPFGRQPSCGAIHIAHTVNLVVQKILATLNEAHDPEEHSEIGLITVLKPEFEKLSAIGKVSELSFPL
jgi:hypothetical protein